MKGNLVSYDGGKFRIEVTYESTTNAIKFTPYINVTDAFNKSHAAKITWTAQTTVVKRTVKEKKKYYVNDKKKTQKQSVKAYTVKVTAEIGGKKSTCTLTAGSQKPSMPEIGISVEGGSYFVISAIGTATVDKPVTNVYLQKKVDVLNQDSWQDLSPEWSGNRINSYSLSYDDQDLTVGQRYKYRIRAHNSYGYSEWIESDWLYTQPPDVSTVEHTRLNNTSCRIAVSQVGSEIDRQLITGWQIERSDSGSAWKIVGTLYPEKTGGVYTNRTVEFIDSTCEADNYYKYRVRPMNSAGVSSQAYPSDSGTEATYNTPAAPVSITATLNNGGSTTLKIDNRAKTAEALQIEKYTGSWSQIAEIDETTDICTEYTDTSTSSYGEIKYRACNVRTSDLSGDARYSSKTESNIVEMLSAPEAPTLVSPANGRVIAISENSIKLEWVHNPTDGTAQRTADIRIYKNGTLDRTLSETTNQYRSVNTSIFSAGDLIEWQVKTRGQSSTWSDWSEKQKFTICAAPEVHFTAPENGADIDNLPLNMAFMYSDASGSLALLKLEILYDDEIQYSKDLYTGSGASGIYTYSLADFLFENGTGYKLRVTALSSTGLEAVDEIGIKIDYVPVVLTNQLYVDTETDPETGYVVIKISSGTVVQDEEFDGEIVNSPVTAAYLYRIYDGEKHFVKEVHESEQLIDKMAPLNNSFVYELVEVAQNGQIAIVDQECEISSDLWYVYYGAALDKIAKALWDPNGEVSLERPEKQLVRYSGREYPVSYDSGAMGETYGFTFTLTNRDELNAFRALMKSGGHGIWKSADGFVYPADFEFSFSADYTKKTQAWACKLEVTRTEGDV